MVKHVSAECIHVKCSFINFTKQTKRIHEPTWLKKIPSTMSDSFCLCCCALLISERVHLSNRVTIVNTEYCLVYQSYTITFQLKLLKQDYLNKDYSNKDCFFLLWLYNWNAADGEKWLRPALKFSGTVLRRNRVRGNTSTWMHPSQDATLLQILFSLLSSVKRHPGSPAICQLQTAAATGLTCNNLPSYVQKSNAQWHGFLF